MALSSFSSDFLEHFLQDAFVTAEFTKHIDYKSDITRGTRKEPVEVKWHRRRHIGSGTYGEVWLEVKDDGVTERAVKILDKDKVQRLGIDYKRELLALAKFSKPRYQQEEVLIKFLAWFKSGPNIYLCMEYFEFGDLEKHMADIATEDDVRDIAINVLNGLSIMHSENFAHRDLKPGNIFVVQKPPIAHYISKQVKAEEETAFRTQASTPAYQAPEISGCIDSIEPTSVYDNSVDLWSAGCIIYKLGTQSVPFPNMWAVTKFCEGTLPLPTELLLERFSPEGVSFVQSLIVPDARKRLSAEEALSTPWLSKRNPKLSASPVGSFSSHARHDSDEATTVDSGPLSDCHDTLRRMNSVALSLYKQNKFKESESIYRQVIELQEMVYGAENPETLKSMSTLAVLFNNQERYESAEGMHRHILEIRKKVLGTKDPDTMASMNNLANSLNNQGRYEAAEEIYRHTLKVQMEVLGHEHPDTLKTMNSLATSFHSQRRYKEAESLYRDTLKIRQKVLGPESLETLRTMNSLANTLNNQGQYKAAEVMHRQVLNLRDNVLGPRHSDTIISATNLARSLKNQGDYNAANKLLAERELSS